MATRAQRQLWKGIDLAATVKVRGTVWTCAPMLMVHASRVPVPSHKKIIPMKTRPAAVAAWVTAARSHRPGRVLPSPLAGSKWVSYAWSPIEVVAVVPVSVTAGPAGRVLAGFPKDQFKALSTILAGCELRFDIWNGTCSWWNLRAANPYPVAVLAGMYHRPVLKDTEVLSA